MDDRTKALRCVEGMAARRRAMLAAFEAYSYDATPEARFDSAASADMPTVFAGAVYEDELAAMDGAGDPVIAGAKPDLAETRRMRTSLYMLRRIHQDLAACHVICSDRYTGKLLSRPREDAYAIRTCAAMLAVAMAEAGALLAEAPRVEESAAWAKCSKLISEELERARKSEAALA